MTCGLAGLALMRLGDLLGFDDELWLLVGTDCDESHRWGCERSDVDVGAMAVLAATCMTLRPVLCSYSFTTRGAFVHLSIDETGCVRIRSWRAMQPLLANGMSSDPYRLQLS